jgi:hypothetical protein
LRAQTLTVRGWTLRMAAASAGSSHVLGAEMFKVSVLA